MYHGWSIIMFFTILQFPSREKKKKKKTPQSLYSKHTCYRNQIVINAQNVRTEDKRLFKTKYYIVAKQVSISFTTNKR